MNDTEQKEVAFFNDTSTSYLAEYDRTTTDGHSFRSRREKVLALIDRTENGTALDLACGPGILVRGLRDKGYTVTGVDAAPEMIARAQEQFGTTSGVTLLVANAYQLPFPDESFDVVTALGLLEYLETEEVALREIVRVLKPGGVAILTYPNASSPWRWWTRISLRLYRALDWRIKLTRASGHTLTHREYRERAVSKMIEAAGLTIEASSYYNFKLVPYPFDQWFPRLTVWQSRVLEYSLPHALRTIGTGFILRARKR